MKLLTTTLAIFLFFAAASLPAIVIAVGETPATPQGQISEDTFTAEVGDDGTLLKGFVPCSGNGCSACDFVVMANTIIKWLIGICFLFFAVLAVIAGFKLVTGGTPSDLSAAKQSFTNAFIGLIIIFAAWLVVDTLMKKLLTNPDDVYSGYGPWSEIQCGSQAGSDIVENFVEGDYDVAPPSPLDKTIPSGLPTGPVGKSGLNVAAAVAHLVNNANSKSTGYCLRYVSEAINAGLSSYATRGVKHAKDSGPKLVQAGFTKVYSGTYSYPATDNAFKAQPGDVAVFQPGCTRSISGHTAMYSGRIWISDYRQAEIGPNKTGTCSIAIYRP